MTNNKRSRPVGRRPSSREPLPAGGFRFSEVNLNSDPSENEEKPIPTPAAPLGNMNRPGVVGRPAGIGGLKPLSTGATVQPSNIQPASQGAAQSPQVSSEPRSTGGFFPRSAVPPSRQPGGIAMEHKPADLESIGHAMKSQNTRIHEAEQKYGAAGPSAVGPSTPIASSSKFSYANPPPPELRPKETLPIVNRTGANQQPQDLEANKPAPSGKGKRTFMLILIGLLVSGLIAGAVVAIVLTNKPPAKPNPKPTK